MSESTTDQPNEAGTDSVETGAEQGDPAETLGEGGKKALKAERDRANAAEAELKAAKARLTEIERANESAIERAEREAKEAKEEAAQAAVDVLKFRIAAQHNIAPEDADLFLTGSDADTLTRQAARLVERIPTASPTPKPDRSQGGSGTPAPLTTADAFAQAVESHFN